MIFKRFKTLSSPKKFIFRDPDTLHPFTGSSIPDLISQITGYRSQNELPPLELLPVVIENYLCTLPVHVGCCEPVKGPKRSFMQYVQGGIALLKNVAYQSFATQEEADARSAICVKCPHNVFPDRGPFLKWIEDLAERSVGKRKSKYHTELGLCEICTCPLRSKVFYNGKVQLTKENYEQMASLDNPKCWQVPLYDGKEQ